MPRKRSFDHDKVRALHAQGLSRAALMERFGISKYALDYALHPEAYAAKSKRWHEKNRERELAKMRERYQRRKAADPDFIRKQGKWERTRALAREEAARLGVSVESMYERYDVAEGPA